METRINILCCLNRISVMDKFIEEYVAFELFEEALCEPTDVACPDCEASLLFDRERQLFLCPECRGEFVAENG